MERFAETRIAPVARAVEDLTAENTRLRELLAAMEARLAAVEARPAPAAPERPARPAAPARPARAPRAAGGRASPADTRKDFESFLHDGEMVYVKYKGVEYAGRFHLRTNSGAAARAIARRARDTDRIGAITHSFIPDCEDYSLSPSAFCSAVKAHANGDDVVRRSPGWDECYVKRDGENIGLWKLRADNAVVAAAPAAPAPAPLMLEDGSVGDREDDEDSLLEPVDGADSDDDTNSTASDDSDEEED